MKVSGEYVQRIHCCHAVPLSHQPAPGPPGQIVQGQIAGVRRHHVQCAAGVAFWIGLEVLGGQGLTGDINPAGVGHMNHQPHTGAGQPVQIGEFAIDGSGVRLMPGSHQVLCEYADLMLGGFTVLDDAITIGPTPEIRAVRSGVIHRSCLNG